MARLAANCFMTKIEQRILNSSLVQWIVYRTRHIFLPGFHKLPLYDVIVFFISQIRKVGLNERAAAISFNFLMAIPAGTIFLCTLIPYLPISKQVTDELLQLVRDYTINQNTYNLIKNFLEDFLQTERSGLLSLGFLLVIYYASNAMMGIMRSFDKSLIYSSRRNFLQKRWMAIKLTLLVLIMVLLSIVLLSLQGPVLNWILQLLHIKNSIIKVAILMVRWIVLLALVYYSIAFIYKYAPAVHKRWRLSSPGTTLATFMIILTTFLFSFWVNHFGNFNKVYGSIGTILIIMILVDINSLVLLIGYELNVSIHSLKHQADERAKRETDGKFSE
jgi:membrane protein